MAKKHIHKYHHIRIAAGKLWACALADCTHYMPRHLENTLLGKASICWKCENNFILDTLNMMDDRPICNECVPKSEETNKLLDYLNLLEQKPETSEETNEKTKD